MSEQPAEPTPQERLDAATEAFAQLNNMLPPGMPPFQLPPFLEPTATLNALTATLLESGVISEDAFLAAKVAQMAVMTEQCVDAAREVKRQMMGLVVAGQIPEI